jgi:hypothetical protein
MSMCRLSRCGDAAFGALLGALAAFGALFGAGLLLLARFLAIRCPVLIAGGW